MSTMSNKTSATTAYFDLHTTGIGYLGRIRKVQIKKGAFYSCTIGALRGEKPTNPDQKPEYTYFDVVIRGKQALERVLFLESAVKNNQRVLVNFKIGDIYAEMFEYQSGSKKGQQGICMKGRLLQIGHSQIDGVKVDWEAVGIADEPHHETDGSHEADGSIDTVDSQQFAA